MVRENYTLVAGTVLPAVVQIVVKYFQVLLHRYARAVFMNASVSDAAGTNIPITVAGELERRPIWPAFVIAFAIATTLLWTAILAWLLFRITAFLIT
jgi:hypothetical protein